MLTKYLAQNPALVWRRKTPHRVLPTRYLVIDKQLVLVFSPVERWQEIMHRERDATQLHSFLNLNKDKLTDLADWLTEWPSNRCLPQDLPPGQQKKTLETFGKWWEWQMFKAQTEHGSVPTRVSSTNILSESNKTKYCGFTARLSPTDVWNHKI